MTQETTPLEDALEGQESQTTPEPQAEPVVTDEPKTEPTAPVSDDGQIKVPLAALHEVRDANRALKMEVEALKASQQSKQEAQPAPDMFNDPEGYAVWQQQQTQAAVAEAQEQFNNRLLNMSEAQAIRAHGQDKVEAAKEWALSQPEALRAQIVQQADPFEYAVQEHQKVTLTEQLSDPKTLEKFQAFLAGGAAPTEPKAAPPINTAVDQSVGARQVQWAGPTSLDDIFSN